MLVMTCYTPKDNYLTMSSIPSPRPTILVTNDDGIASPGLHALWQALRSLGEIVVVAPDRNWSAAGHSRTFEGMLRLDPYTTIPTPDGVRLFASSGAPADCVALTIMGAVECPRPDLIVSGINRGSNLGQDITYSGTVAAAMEAAIWHIPALAVSLERVEGIAEDFTAAAQAATHLASQILRVGLPKHTVLNLNAPALPSAAVKGLKRTRLGRRVYRDELIQREDPRGRPYFWMGGLAPSGEVELEGTDIWAVHHGYLSVTPIKLDMTDEPLLETLAEWGIAT